MRKSRYLVLIFLIYNVLGFSQAWSSINPSGGWTDHIAFHPTQPNIMYASGDTHGSLYKSTDGGATWSNLTGYGSYNSWCFEMNPTRPDTIYAGSMMNESDSVGIRLTTDGGLTWQTVLKWPAISQIVVSPSNPDTIFAAAGYWPGYQTNQHGEGLWKSTNGGFSWNKIITNLLDSMSIQTIAINPASTNIMYVGAYGVFGNGKGLYASTTGGNTWYLAGLANKDIWKIAICGNAPNTIYAAGQDSVYKSIDYGSTWTAVSINCGVSEGLFFGLSISKSNNNTVYVGSLNKGIFKSTDGGVTWSSSLNTGLSATRVWDICVHPANPNTVFSGQQGLGIWKSTDGAATWQDANNGFKCHYINDISCSNGQVLAAFYNETGNNFASLKKWDGVNWNNMGLNDLWLNKIKSISAGILYASKVDYGSFSGVPDNKLLKSIDAGATWARLGNGLDSTVEIKAIEFARQNASIVYAGNSKGIYKSTDSGSNFTLSGLSNENVTSICIHTTSTNVIYAGTWSGVFKSVDAGMTWNALNTYTNAIFSLAMLEGSPQILFAGTYQNGILKSADDGVTWNYVSPNLNGKIIQSLVSDTLNPNVVYAGGSMGVYYSIGQGNNNTWQNFSSGLSSNADQVTCLNIDYTTGNLCAGTLGYGAYMRNIFIPTAIKMTNGELPNDLLLFPNPAKSVLHIRASNFELQTISIFDLLGNKLEEFNFSNSINISFLISGVYILNFSNKNKEVIYRRKILITD